MIRPAVLLIVAATAVAACDSQKIEGWTYTHQADQLRGGTTTRAFLNSNEHWGDETDRPQMELKVTTGSPDAKENGVEFTSDSYGCNNPISIRVDNQPIETVPPTEHGPCMSFPLDALLAKRIIASKRVVIELDGAGGPQITFNTEGLDLPGR